MKTIWTTVALMSVVLVAEGAPPAKGKKKGPRPPATVLKDDAKTAVLKPYDKNGDWQIDVGEFAAVETDFLKTPKGPLEQFDKGKDGEVDAMIDRAYMNVLLGSAKPKGKAKAGASGKPAAKPAAGGEKPAPKPVEKPGSEAAGKPEEKAEVKPVGE
jgi:hypothetical protein